VSLSNLANLDFPPPGFDFWRSAREMGEKAVAYANKELKEAENTYKNVAKEVREFQSSMIRLNEMAQEFRAKEGFFIPNFDVEEFTQKLHTEIEVILEELKAEFCEPLPEDQTERYIQREKAVNRALDKTEGALVKVYKMFGVREFEVREKFNHLRPHIKHVVLVTANLIDNHPELVTTLLVTGVILIIPESWFLRPLLRSFGFGPLGPAKGSAAAWAQRYFFRTTIPEGSWFSFLQRAGMKWDLPGKFKIPFGIGAGIAGFLFAGCHGRRR